MVNEQLMALTFSSPEWIGICEAISQRAAVAETQMAATNCLHLTNNDTAGQQTNEGAAAPAAATMEMIGTGPNATDGDLMKIVKYHNEMKVS